MLAAALLCLGISCGDGREPAAPPRDLLLITVDTARADRFSYTGEGGPGTPRIDALAAQGAGFVNAISPVPLTLPAHASLLTGRQPPSHGVRDNGSYRLPDAETTLAELLEAAGFATAAFVGAQVLDARYGLDQGFATYDDEIPDPGDSPFLYYPERAGEEVAAAASRWLDEQGETPVFVWVHLFDPHTPYRPPEPERSRHASAYDGEIAYVDRVVGMLLDHWEARRGLDRTLVVLTSDHGEGLGDHEEQTHGVLVHDATLRVPLVIRAPGRRVERLIDSPVSLIDLLPTIATLFDLPVPDGAQGRDLGPLLRGEELPWRPVAGYAESLYAQLHHGCAPLLALRQGGWKLTRGTVSELYDLAVDPKELHDLAGVEPERALALAETLDELAKALAHGDAERVELDDETRRGLQALGYIWSTPAGGGATGAPCDPREALHSLARMADADRRALRGDTEGAVADYRAVIAAEPASVDARVRLSEVLAAHGRGAEAVNLLEDAVELAPHHSFLFRKLGVALERSGKYERGLSVYDAGLERHPASRDLRDGRWRCLNQLGRQDEMLAEAERAIAEDPADGMARYARAIACCGQPLQAYIAALERELSALPDDPILRTALVRARAEASALR